MIKIYHNPRCTKSRQGLELLEKSGLDFEVIKYLNETISVKELSYIVKTLAIEPIDLVRKNEAIWKDNYKNKTFTDKELINIMIENPKLIERPIVINKNKAVIGRPTENINTIL